MKMRLDEKEITNEMLILRFVKTFDYLDYYYKLYVQKESGPDGIMLKENYLGVGVSIFYCFKSND